MLNEIVIQIIEKNINEKIESIKQITFGYSRLIYQINDKYILNPNSNRKIHNKAYEFLGKLIPNNPEINAGISI